MRSIVGIGFGIGLWCCMGFTSESTTLGCVWEPAVSDSVLKPDVFSRALSPVFSNEVRIGFYNLENLFDTIDAPGYDDSEYTPAGARHWTGARYVAKLDHLAGVIALLKVDLLGVSEVEGPGVLSDLVGQVSLGVRDYGYLWSSQRDGRGMGVGLLYDRARFHPREVTFPAQGLLPRGHLLVRGTLCGEEIYVLVAHLSSRLSKSTLREEGAWIIRHTVDSLAGVDPAAKILLVGDFNADAGSELLRKCLAVEHRVRGEDFFPNPAAFLFNPFYRNYERREGTLVYRDRWHLFDQILVNGNFLLGHGLSVLPGPDHGAVIFQRDFLFFDTGRFRGYPLRTFVGDRYRNGYSDHLPIYLPLEVRL